ncbi:hypothetical protein [Mycobacterium sp. 155]|uniref:hypothetical protein n=1 Tax=Mycobacterium sp. 155 TaxID=1157943 RepID=UPI0009DB172B|nr:hypothetical protein [Mycobacterium sp. 155]
MNQIRFTAATFLTATIAASCAAAPAAADPTGACATPSPELTHFCSQLDQMQQLHSPPVPTTTAPGTSGGETLYAGHPLWHYLVLGAVVALVIAAVVKLAGSAVDDAEKTAAEQAAELDRGRRIAQDAGTEHAERSPEDLRRYADFGWAVPWQQGTAFGNLVTRDGDTSRVYAAWAEACQLARLGHWDEAGTFTPAAAVVNVNGYSDDDTGDLELAVNTADYTVGARELNRVLEHLVRTARVETASDFTRDAVRDWHVTRLSMIPKQQQAAPAPEPEASVPDPAAGWEW